MFVVAETCLGNISAAVKETKRAFCGAGFFFVSPYRPFSPWHAFYPALFPSTELRKRVLPSAFPTPFSA